MKIKCIAVVLCVLMLVLSGCGVNSDSNDTVSTEAVESSTTEDNVSNVNSDMFTDRDLDASYDVSTSTKITLNKTTASSDSNAVEISGSTVTIKDEGTYILSGTLENGTIIVDAEETDKPQIVLDNVSVTNSSFAALYVLECDKLFVTLADSSENTLSNSGSFTAIDDNNVDGAVFSKQDLTFNGSGKLTVESTADHGVVCKDDLVFTGGEYDISSASHALDANDSVRITKAQLTLNSGKDGIHSENDEDTEKGFVYMYDGTVNIEAQGDGISSSAYTQVVSGSIDILSGGGSENGSSQSSDYYGGFMGGGHGGMNGQQQSSTTTTDDDSTSMKGIKSTANLSIEGGTITIDSADDSIHSNASATISGGTLTLKSGDDGVHADESLTVSGGTIDVTESYEGLEALDIAVTGGDISLVASDDGLNAAGGTDSSGMQGRDNGMFGGGGGMSSSNGSISISGGELYIEASGDGIDANGTLEISGGYTVVSGPTSGDTATLDYDVSGIITGGTFIGTGAQQMAQSFSDCENQGVLALTVGSQQAGATITVSDGSTQLIEHTPSLNYSLVIISSPDIVKGKTYSVTVGSQSGEITAN